MLSEKFRHFPMIAILAGIVMLGTATNSYAEDKSENTQSKSSIDMQGPYNHIVFNSYLPIKNALRIKLRNTLNTALQSKAEVEYEGCLLKNQKQEYTFSEKNNIDTNYSITIKSNSDSKENIEEMNLCEIIKIWNN